MKDHISTFGRYTQIYLISLVNIPLSGSADSLIDGQKIEDNRIICLSNQDNKDELGFYNCNIVDNKYVLTLIPQMGLKATENTENQYNAGYPFIFEVIYGLNYGTYKYSQDGSYASFRKLAWGGSGGLITQSETLDITIPPQSEIQVSLLYKKPFSKIIGIFTQFNSNIAVFVTERVDNDQAPDMQIRYLKNWSPQTLTFRYKYTILGE